MIPFTEAGKALVAELLSHVSLTFAWGSGSQQWSATDYELSNMTQATSLHHEVGRRTISIVGFAQPDSSGSVETPDGNYRIVATPTDLLYLRVIFDYQDNDDDVIREIGVFAGADVDAALPAGQQFFTPDQVMNIGTLIAAKRLAEPLYRTANTRQSFDLIIPVVT